MTPDKGIRADIQRDERWLDEVADTPAGPSTDAVKRRVRIALGERWLGSQPPVEPPQDLSQRVKRRVWAECGRLRDAGRSTVVLRRSYRLRRWTASAAAVAAFAFVGRAMWPVIHPPDTPVVVRLDTVMAGPDLAETLYQALMNVVPSEDDVALALLEHDVRMMELTVSEPAGYGSDDGLVDELYDESERLLAELEAGIF